MQHLVSLHVAVCTLIILYFRHRLPHSDPDLVTTDREASLNPCCYLNGQKYPCKCLPVVPGTLLVT